MRLLCLGDGGLETEADELRRVHCRVWTLPSISAVRVPERGKILLFLHGHFLSVEKKLTGTMRKLTNCGINASLYRGAES